MQRRTSLGERHSLVAILFLVAIIIGCVMLVLEVGDYGDQPYQLSLSAPVEYDDGAGTDWAREASRGNRALSICPSV